MEKNFVSRGVQQMTVQQHTDDESCLERNHIVAHRKQIQYQSFGTFHFPVDGIIEQSLTCVFER